MDLFREYISAYFQGVQDDTQFAALGQEVPAAVLDVQPEQEPVAVLDVQPEQEPVAVLDVQPEQEPVAVLDVQPEQEPVAVLDVQPEQEPVAVLDVQPEQEPVAILDVQPEQEPVADLGDQPKQDPAAELDEQETPVIMSKYAVGYNHLIMREAADYLSIEDLKTLRQVSPHWNHNFSSAYFRASTVSINSLESLSRYTDEIGELVHSQFNLYIRRQGIGGNFLVNPVNFRPFFAKYGLQIVKLELKLRLWEHRLQPLQGWLGLLRTLENMKELSIDWDFWGNVPPIPYVIPELPSLQKLTIDFYDRWNTIEATDAQQFGSSFVDVILSLAPNIQYLIVWNLSTEQHIQDWRYNFFSRLVEKIKQLPSSQLNKLCFNGCFEILQSLRGFPIPLTKLTVHVDKRSPHLVGQMEMDRHAYDHLNNLLRIHAESLEHLYVHVKSVEASPGIQRFCIRLPDKFPKLMSLRLRFDKHNADLKSKYEFPMTPITDYQERFPNLETLWVAIGGFNFPIEQCRDCVHGVMFPPGGRACHSVRNVSLPMPYERLQLEHIKKRCRKLQSEIGRMFPNANMEIFEKDFVPDPKYVI